jgi:hypothetical protein
MNAPVPAADATPDPWFPPPGVVLPNGMPQVICFRVDFSDRLALNLKAGEPK